MARKSQSGAALSTPTSARSSGDVKMVKRHTEYIEADVEATQEADEGAKVSGTNPYRKGTAAWGAFENRKRQEKGLPATNAINE